MSPELLAELLFAVLAGAVAGVFYFGGLWFTVNRLDKVQRPLMFLALSSALRLGLIVTAAILVLLAGAKHWHVLAALTGFLVLRQLLLIRLRIKKA